MSTSELKEDSKDSNSTEGPTSNGIELQEKYDKTIVNELNDEIHDVNVSQNINSDGSGDVQLKTGENANASVKSPEQDENLSEDDGWLDILGNGELKKRVIKEGKGPETQAKKGDLVKFSYVCYDDKDTVLEQDACFEMHVGDLDMIQGLDLIIPLTQDGEVLEALVPSRLAYGKIGRPPNIPPNCDLRFEIEVLSISKFLEEELGMKDVLEIGNKKRERGNFWYGRTEYLNAIHCYQRAAEILDGGHDGSESGDDLLQNVVDTKIKVYNNMAAAQLKLEAYDQALKSVEYVLRIQPKNVKAHFRKAKILIAKGQTDGALVSMKKAAELEPDTKVIQQELQKLMHKKKIEEKSQREMYKRMFPASTSKSKSFIKRWIMPWSILAAGSGVALAVGLAAYKQYFT